jgi:hypothetical protein
MIRYDWGCGKKYQYMEFSPSDADTLETTGYLGCLTLDYVAEMVSDRFGPCEFADDPTVSHEFKRAANPPPNMVIYRCTHEPKAKGVDLETYFVKESNE